MFFGVLYNESKTEENKKTSIDFPSRFGHRRTYEPVKEVHIQLKSFQNLAM